MLNFSRLRFHAGEAVIAPTALEYDLSVKWYGADLGVFPGSTANTALTVKANSIRFSGGEELRDFKAGMDLESLKRIVGQDSSVTLGLNLLHPSHFVRKYQSEGPLAEVTVTATNDSGAGGTTDQTFVFKGIMRVPDMSFIDNPGTVDVTIEMYGNQPTITIPASPT